MRLDVDTAAGRSRHRGLAGRVRKHGLAQIAPLTYPNKIPSGATLRRHFENLLIPRLGWARRQESQCHDGCVPRAPVVLHESTGGRLPSAHAKLVLAAGAVIAGAAGGRSLWEVAGGNAWEQGVMLAVRSGPYVGKLVPWVVIVSMDMSGGVASCHGNCEGVHCFLE